MRISPSLAVGAVFGSRYLRERMCGSVESPRTQEVTQHGGTRMSRERDWAEEEGEAGARS